MLILKLDKKDELELFNLILEILLRYSHAYEIARKNFRFVLEFFKTGLTDKELGFFPWEASKRILNSFKTYQVDNMFAISALGLNWTESDVLNCINNVLKLGVADSTYRILKAFIEMFKRLRKHLELVQAFEKNIYKIFVFLKYNFFNLDIHSFTQLP